MEKGKNNYDDADKEVKAFKALKDSSYENKQLMVLLLPAIQVINLLLFLIKISKIL